MVVSFRKVQGLGIVCGHSKETPKCMVRIQTSSDPRDGQTQTQRRSQTLKSKWIWSFGMGDGDALGNQWPL